MHNDDYLESKRQLIEMMGADAFAEWEAEAESKRAHDDVIAKGKAEIKAIEKKTSDNHIEHIAKVAMLPPEFELDELKTSIGQLATAMKAIVNELGGSSRAEIDLIVDALARIVGVMAAKRRKIVTARYPDGGIAETVEFIDEDSQ